MIRVLFMCAAIQRSVEKAVDVVDSHVVCHASLDFASYSGQVDLSGFQYA